MQRLTYRLLAVAALGLTLLGSCSKDKKTDGSNNGEKRLKVAVVPKGSTHSFWKAVHAGAEKAGEELGVEVIWQGPQKEDDRQMQIQTVQNFISRGVDAIVLAPLDNRALVPPVKAAAHRKIPVVIIDSDLEGKDYQSFVATDNYEGGKLCAQRMIELLGGKGKVVVLRYQEGSASTTKREQGFIETIKRDAPGIELVSDNQYAGATIEKAFQSAQNMVNRFTEINGVFCSNESTTQGMLRALKTAGKAKTVKLVGFDANPTLVEAVKAGEIQGLAVQNPFQMGYEGVKTVVAILKNQPYQERLNTGVVLVTEKNVNDPNVKGLL